MCSPACRPRNGRRRRRPPPSRTPRSGPGTGRGRWRRLPLTGARRPGGMSGSVRGGSNRYWLMSIGAAIAAAETSTRTATNAVPILKVVSSKSVVLPFARPARAAHLEVLGVFGVVGIGVSPDLDVAFDVGTGCAIERDTRLLPSFASHRTLNVPFAAAEQGLPPLPAYGFVGMAPLHPSPYPIVDVMVQLRMASAATMRRTA